VREYERSWGRGYEALGEGGRVQEWGLGVQGRVTHHYLPQPPEA